MKKSAGFMVAMVLVIGMGTAYAVDYNGVTDFSGRSYDMFQIGPAGAAAVSGVYEGSAAGSKRLVEGPGAASRHIHDTVEFSEQSDAKPGLTRNWAGKDSSTKSYDNFEIETGK